MKRIARSEQIEQALHAFLGSGMDSSEQPVSEVVKLATQLIVQKALEQEVAYCLGRERYERRQEDQEGLRHGNMG